MCLPGEGVLWRLERGIIMITMSELLARLTPTLPVQEGVEADERRCIVVQEQVIYCEGFTFPVPVRFCRRSIPAEMTASEKGADICVCAVYKNGRLTAIEVHLSIGCSLQGLQLVGKHKGSLLGVCFQTDCMGTWFRTTGYCSPEEMLGNLYLWEDAISFDQKGCRYVLVQSP